MDCSTFAFDLHVLGTPPALILSQDQTLMLRSSPIHSPACAGSLRDNLLTRGRFGFCVVQSVLSIRGRRQSPSHGLTTPVDRLMRRHALTLCPPPGSLTRALGVTGLLCACTHYLVFKEPTVCAPVAPSPRKRRAGCQADRIQGNLARLLERFSLVNLIFAATERHARPPRFQG
jgi:hypothetical protein